MHGAVEECCDVGVVQVCVDVWGMTVSYNVTV